MKQVIEWSKGNPGAMMFLMSLTEPENFPYAIVILQKLEECSSIRGTNLYVLWSDLGSKNLQTVQSLCDKCPNSILEDACSRQDYSGRKLVEEYLN